MCQPNDMKHETCLSETQLLVVMVQEVPEIIFIYLVTINCLFSAGVVMIDQFVFSLFA